MEPQTNQPAVRRPPFLGFTDAERSMLDGARNALALRLSRKVTLDVWGGDCDEYATIALSEGSREGAETLVSVQIIRKGGRSFAVITPDGRFAPRTEPSTDLAALLPQLHRAAVVWFRSAVPNIRASMLAAVIPLKDFANAQYEAGR